MGCRSLAEAVILQSIEDLWSPHHREESREFFKGDGFKIYAKIAELSSLKQIKIMHITGEKKNDRTVRAN